MAQLKTYSISNDITSGQCSAGKLHSEITDAGYVIGFDGLTIEGDNLMILGDSINDVPGLDVLVLAHDGVAPIDNNWYPTAITLGDVTGNGAAKVLSSSGYYFNFDAMSNDELVINLGLERNGSAYDGSNVRLDLDWMLYGVPSAGETVHWELEYAFVGLGENAYNANDGIAYNTVDVTGRTNQILYEDSLPVISGPASSKTLQMKLRRKSSGQGSDTYDGGAEIYGIQLIKI